MESPMKVHLLIAHHNESYPGQHAPNVMIACDEYTMDDNPTWWTENVAKEKTSIGEANATFAEIVITIDDDAMLDALYPTRKPIPAALVG
jgi:hypothetical protein